MTSRPLRLEALEDRSVPATWGNPWPDAAHLTLSFVPDGTSIGGQNSTLFQSLDALGPRAVWQREILRAFQTWADQAGVTIGLVADGGQPLGTPGRLQGDPRFGDIRIGAGEYSTEVLAFSTPFDPTAGTWSGDVRLNLRALLGSDGTPRFDLYTAFLQEAGHVLGVGNSGDTRSAMYEEYLGPRAGLAEEDIAAVQALYGARPADAHEGTSGNDTVGSATRVGLVRQADGLLGLGLTADLTRVGDQDHYTFRAPSLLGGLLIRLHREGWSLVTPRVSVLDSRGRVVGQVESTDPTGGDLILRLGSVTPLGQYTIRVEGVADESFRIGSYGLSVRSLPLLSGLTSSLDSLVADLGATLVSNDLHTNDTMLTASLLPLSGLFAPTSRFDYAFQASISDRWDVDFYRVQAPATAAGDNVLTVMAWSTGSSALLPRLALFDGRGNPVAAEVLVNEAGNVTLQAVGVTPGATYFVKVESAADSGPAAVGNYFLGIDFGVKAIRLKTFADSTLDAAMLQESATLDIYRTGLFHFVLSAESAGGTGVQLTITDADGSLVSHLVAAADEAVSVTLTLAPGRYTFTFSAVAASGQPVRAVRHRLKGLLLSDPIGPQPSDPTEEAAHTQESQPPPATEPPPADPTPPPDEPMWEQEYYWYQWYYYDETTYGGPPEAEPTDGGYRT